MAGINLIPAWAFKDSVNSFLNTMNHETAPTTLDALWASIILLISTSLGAVLPHDDPNNGCLKAFGAKILMTLPLGNGFAFNSIVKHAAEDNWNKVGFQNVYVPIITFLVLQERHIINGLLAKNKGRPLVTRFWNFQMAIGEFCAAWAWNALLINTAKEVFPSEHASDHIWQAIVWALMVTTGAMMVSLFGGKTELWIFFNKLAGINIGWAWMDVGKACFNRFVHGSDGNATVLLKTWTISLGIAVITPLFGFLLLKVLQNEASMVEKVKHTA
jgi:hypothetical protein